MTLAYCLSMTWPILLVVLGQVLVKSRKWRLVIGYVAIAGLLVSCRLWDYYHPCTSVWPAILWAL